MAVELKALDSSHIDLAREWRNNPAINQWCRQYSPISDRQQEVWFKRQSDDSSINMFSIYDEYTFIGVCGLTSIDMVNRRAEFSLYVAPSYQGGGFGKAALKDLVAYGFCALGLNQIYGEVFDGNPAMGMFESVGFTKDGTRRQFYYRNGKFIDSILISLTREEWDYDRENGVGIHNRGRSAKSL